MKDLSLTWISGKTFCMKPEVLVYIHSLVASGFDGDKIAFVSGAPKSFVKLIESFGFEVHSIPIESLTHPYHDRHIHYYKLLTARKHEYRNVLITDVKDVLFQLNPQQFLNNIRYRESEFCMLSLEGMLHKDSFWNLEDQKKFQKNLNPEQCMQCTDWPIVNCGVLFGTLERVRQLTFSIWLSHLREFCGDQACLNFICNQTDDPTLVFNHPAASNFCVTGEGMLANKYSPAPDWDDKINKIVNVSTDRPYYIFHQWDRTQFSERILKEWA